MDNFRVIYKILRLLEETMDNDEFDISCISDECLGISKNRLNRLLILLQDDGYIQGIIYKTGAQGVKISPHLRITIKGLEYLEENSMMKKAAAIVKGIKDTIPGF